MMQAANAPLRRDSEHPVPPCGAHPPVEATVERTVELLRTFEVWTHQARDSLHPLSMLRRVGNGSRYASPEQSRGHGTTPQSLVYSVGVLLFEKLTGCHPFLDAPLPTAVDVKQGAARVEGIPTPLRAILLRALSPFPADRQPTIRVLREQLESCRAPG